MTTGLSVFALVRKVTGIKISALVVYVHKLLIHSTSETSVMSVRISKVGTGGTSGTSDIVYPHPVRLSPSGPLV